MKYNHLVKFNGVYYPAGTDVPIEETKGGSESPAPSVSGKVETKEEPVAEEKPSDGRKYSEEDLQVGFMKLKALAKKEGLILRPEYKSKEIRELLRAL